jgi:hypothetical protein
MPACDGSSMGRIESELFSLPVKLKVPEDFLEDRCEEPSIRSFGGCHSIQLSYERVCCNFTAVCAPSPMMGESRVGRELGTVFAR